MNFARYSSGVKVIPGNGIPKGVLLVGDRQTSYFLIISAKNTKIQFLAKTSPKHLRLPVIQYLD